MNEKAWSGNVSLSFSAARRVDTACDRFERRWREGGRPAIEDFLADLPEEERPALVRELVPMDADFRRRAGEEPRPEDYQARFPDLDPTWLTRVLASLPDKGLVALSVDSAEVTGTRRLRCPQCQSPIQLADGQGEVVLCPGCGSSFHIRDARQTTTTQAMRQVGKFQLLERVGLGAFGAVWKARDTELDRIVALKIPHTGLLTSDTDLERFHREARAAAQLRHPGVVTVHEVRTLDGLPTIVADFIHGITLRDLLEVRRLTFREAATLIAEVAEALDYAHQMGLVHRDLKPANIMVETPRLRFEGNDLAPEDAGREPDRVGRPLVMDFGLALRAEAEITMTTDGHILGTPAYMSPEQAAGYSHRADARSDVYSVGVILYQLLTGELPFRGSKAMLLHQVQYEEPRPPRTINDKIPRDLETVCLKALAKAPGRRYARAGELAEDLRRFLRAEPVQARPVGRVERLGSWCQRNPLTAGLIAAVAIALVAGTAVSVAFAFRASAKAEEASLNESRANAEAQEAKEQKDRADVKAEEARANLYVAHMNLVQDYYEEGNAVTARHLVDQYREPGATRRDLRGWEWYYLDRLTHPELRTFEGHQGPIAIVVFSPDGARLASTSGDGNVRLWDLTTGQLLHTFPGRPLVVNNVVFSPDGTRLASVGNDGTMRLWDVVTGQLLNTFRGHPGVGPGVAFSPDGITLTALGGAIVAFSPDGTRLASAVGRNGIVRLWDAGSGHPLHIFQGHRGSIQSVVYSPDGTHLASAGQDNTVRLWDVASGQPVYTLRGHRAPVQSVVYSPDGTRLASAGFDSTVRLWDVTTGQLLHTLRGHRGEITNVVYYNPDIVQPLGGGIANVVYSPDGTRLASAGGDGTVRLWDMTSGQLLHTLQGHRGSVASVVYSPDGTRLASAGNDGTVRLWEAGGGRPLHTLGGHRDRVGSVVFSPDGTRLASAGNDGTVRLWEAGGGLPVVIFEGHRGFVANVVYSPDGARLASAGQDGTVRLWDVASGQHLLSFHGAQGRILRVVYSPDGTRLASAGQDGTVRLWDVESGQLLHTLQGHRGLIQSVVYSPDGTRLASAGQDGTVWLWDAATGQFLHTLSGHRGSVLGVVYSPDGGRLASAGGDGTVRLWDVTSGQLLHTLQGHRGLIQSVVYSPDGTRLAAANRDGTVWLWESASGQHLHSLHGHQGSIRSVVFSPNGARLASAGEDGTVWLWDVASGQPFHILQGHRGTVERVVFSPNGARLASAGNDGTVRLWESASGQPLQTLRGHQGRVASVVFSPDGTRLASAGSDGIVRLWDGRPLTPALRVEREARGLVAFLRAQPLLKADIVQRLRTNPTISEPVRQQALHFAEQVRDDPEWLNQVAWDVVRWPGRSSALYRQARHAAEVACRVQPEDGLYLNTWGVAQYRVGRYAEAVDTLRRSHALNMAPGRKVFLEDLGGMLMSPWRVSRARFWDYPHPADVAFLALAHSRLQHDEEARLYRAWLRYLLQQQRWATDDESQALLREVEAELSTHNTPARK